MDFRLRAFLSVAKNLSFTKASKELEVSQPAITKHIQELESRYNKHFFSRQGGRIELTPQGKLFAEHAERIVQAYERLQFEMDMDGIHLEGGLKLGASMALSRTLFEDFLPWLALRYPHLNPELYAASQSSVQESLFGGKVDFAFVDEVPQHEGLECIPMQQYGFGYLIFLSGKKQTQHSALVTSVELWNNIRKG